MTSEENEIQKLNALCNELLCEKKLLQEKLDFADKTSTEAVERFFEQSRQMKELYKQISENEVETEKKITKAVKEVKFEAEKSAVERCCDVFDDTMGYPAYECTDRIRKSYRIPTKYGY